MFAQGLGFQEQVWKQVPRTKDRDQIKQGSSGTNRHCNKRVPECRQMRGRQTFNTSARREANGAQKMDASRQARNKFCRGTTAQAPIGYLNPLRPFKRMPRRIRTCKAAVSSPTCSKDLSGCVSHDSTQKVGKKSKPNRTSAILCVTVAVTAYGE